MARYYNRNQGPFPARLRNGESALLPGNSWTDVSAEEDGSEDLLRGVQLGFLVRFDDLPAEPPKTPIPTAAVPTGDVPAIPLPFHPEKEETTPEERKSTPPEHGDVG